MGSRSKVKSYTDQALHLANTNEKLDAIARAIYALADFVDDLENQLSKSLARNR